jgi:LmbE family N-acetylglucosaminyl deacetylase
LKGDCVEVVNTLGHDLRRPLSVIRGAATLLLEAADELPRESRDQMLELIAGGVEEMTDMIEGLIAVVPMRTAAESSGLPSGGVAEKVEAGAGKDGEHRFGRVLVVVAHPDDPEFGFGASVAKLADEGSEVYYCICTDGSQGGEDPSLPDEKLTATRYEEQRAAAEVLGVRDVVFLGFRDGYLVANVELRKAITREIRRFKPDLVMTHAPLRATSIPIGASHPDHLAVGEATLAAVYPDARNPRAYSELLAQGFEPHRVKEVWLPGFDGADVFVDATPYMDRKIQAIMCHASQFAGRPDIEEDGGPGKWIRERMKQVGERAGYEYAEGFKKLQTA